MSVLPPPSRRRPSRDALLTLPALALVLLLPCGLRAGEQDPAAPGGPGTPAPERYLRLVQTPDRATLEVASREMVPPGGKGARVWLVGAVHLGDLPYYEKDLQALLDAQEVVLYESVMPPGAGRLRTGTDEERAVDTRVRLRFLASLVAALGERDLEPPADLQALATALGLLDPRLPQFLARALLDGWGHPILYSRGEIAGAKRDFRFASLGADGAPGGEGPAADLEVTAKDVVPALPGASPSAWNLQRELAGALGLSFQGEAIDYSRPSFRVSDMDLDELRRAVEARGGDLGGLEDTLTGSGLTGTAARLLVGLLKVGDKISGGALQVVAKVLVVTLLADPSVEEGGAAGVDRKALAAILEDRNAVVVGDLERLLGEKPGLSSVAVFYGAGHMRDLERRLVAKGYAPGETRWFQAIDVDLANSPVSREQLDRMRAGLQKLLEKR